MNFSSPIKKNFAYNSALTLSSYLVVFITFPYVSRVIGVNRIGLVNFVDNTVNYFLLFAMMGVNLLGIREIASVKDNYEKRSRVFANILGLNIGFTVITLAVYFLLVSVIPKLNQYSELFYIGSAKILCTAFVVEWFFKGLENFRYITLRSIAIKTVYVVGVFLLVKSPDDYKIYFVLTVGTVIVNSLVNFLYVRRFVSPRFGDYFSLKYLKRNGILGIYSIMTSMYQTFNVMFLGLLANSTQVGYYTTAFKLYTAIIGLFSAFTNVMLPRMNVVLAQNQKKRFHQLVEKSFRAMCTFSIPMIVCSMILAPEIIYVLSGPGYEGAVTPMRVIMPAALFVGIAQVLAIQILAPMKKDKVLFTASIIGATVSLTINMSLVPTCKAIGSAIVLLCSELAVTTTYIVNIIQHKIVSIPFDCIWRNLILTLPAVLICFCCKQYINNPFALLAVVIPSVLLVWTGCQRLFGIGNLRR